MGLGLGQKTLVFGHNGEPVSLEPGNITDGISIYVQRQIYDPLVDFKPGTTEPVAGLAVSWFDSPDGKVWTFRLRQGVKFQDGTDLDAEAVKFNTERWWDPKNPTRIDAAARYEIWPELFGGFKGDPASILKEVQVVDKYTLRFVLTQPFPAFPAARGTSASQAQRPSKRMAANMAPPRVARWAPGLTGSWSGGRGTRSSWKGTLTTGRRATRKRNGWCLRSSRTPRPGLRP